jgi:hypothetical protein
MEPDQSPYGGFPSRPLGPRGASQRFQQAGNIFKMPKEFDVFHDFQTIIVFLALGTLQFIYIYAIFRRFNIF